MRSFLYLVFLGAVLVTLALVVRSGIFARKHPGVPINSAMRAALENEGTHELPEADAEIIRAKYPTARRTESGLRYIVRAPGTGKDTPQVGDTIVAQYDGRLLDGTPFDSSYKNGSPFTFHVGVGAVIKGWDEAFLTMHRGEKRTLIVPYWLAYGTTPHGRLIPGRATLVFQVELLDFH